MNKTDYLLIAIYSVLGALFFQREADEGLFGVNRWLLRLAYTLLIMGAIVGLIGLWQ